MVDWVPLMMSSSLFAPLVFEILLERVDIEFIHHEGMWGNVGFGLLDIRSSVCDSFFRDEVAPESLNLTHSRGSVGGDVAGNVRTLLCYAK